MDEKILVGGECFRACRPSVVHGLVKGRDFIVERVEGQIPFKVHIKNHLDLELKHKKIVFILPSS